MSEKIEYKGTFKDEQERKNAEFFAAPIISWEEDEDDSEKYPIRTIFQLFAERYLEEHNVSPEVQKAFRDIAKCKTGDKGYNVGYCQNCQRAVIHTCSCKDRFCPNCQQSDQVIWINERECEMIPGMAVYHVVFTIPSELYGLASANQSMVYGIMFHSAMSAVCDLFEDKKFGGFKPGIISVLHTWKQDMGYHPHIHCIITGGGLSKVGQFVEGQHKGFLLPKEALSSAFAHRVCSGLRDAYNASFQAKDGKKMNLVTIEQGSGMPVIDLNDKKQWYDYVSRLEKMKWVIDIRETCNGKGNAIHYLARYVYRTAISNARIIKYSFNPDTGKGDVTFSYKDYSDNNEIKERTVTSDDFLDMFAKHILPKGFCRVRYGGYLANSVKKKNLKRIAQLLNVPYLVSVAKAHGKLAALNILIFKKDITVCPVCNARMTYFPHIGRDILYRKMQLEKGRRCNEVA